MNDERPPDRIQTESWQMFHTEERVAFKKGPPKLKPKKTDSIQKAQIKS